ncbi:rhodanese-like domain-containing protein [Paenibacillus lutrae]|uniref:Rhodanese-like domain-containing protein n=1 Tax=Paenibacillus lutrae TaxID=2078573 RepID=A0A7X3FFL1_9BACL|nr:rhodanese-like domain-containing protein [Paenibacillus lutrae]MVO98767.1 rhodanese-like domain-containing protein [Paenibacillus lutrae]
MDMTLIINILIVLLVAYFVYTRVGPVKGLNNLGEREFREAMQQSKNKILIDVREPYEFKDGSIPGAANIPLSQLPQRLAEVSKDKDVFLYCRSGMRSKNAAKMLKRSGISKVNHLRGGIGAWSGKLSKSR